MAEVSFVDDESDRLDVSKEEIGLEMKRLADENDVGGMQLLFKTYKDRELAHKEAGVSNEDIEKLAMENLDFVASMSDRHTSHIPFLAKIGKVLDHGKIGKVTSFYRQAVGYKPPEKKV